MNNYLDTVECDHPRSSVVSKKGGKLTCVMCRKVWISEEVVQETEKRVREEGRREHTHCGCKLHLGQPICCICSKLMPLVTDCSPTQPKEEK